MAAVGDLSSYSEICPTSLHLFEKPLVKVTWISFDWLVMLVIILPDSCASRLKRTHENPVKNKIKKNPGRSKQTGEKCEKCSGIMTEKEEIRGRFNAGK